MSIDWIIVPVITGICFIAGLWFKASDKIRDNLIPPLVGTIGAVVGVIAYFINVPWLEAGDILTAIFIGGGSGLAATGVHQVIKQIKELLPDSGDKIHEGTDGDEC